MHFCYSVHLSKQYFLKNSLNQLMCLCLYLFWKSWRHWIGISDLLLYCKKNLKMVVYISSYYSWHYLRIYETVRSDLVNACCTSWRNSSGSVNKRCQAILKGKIEKLFYDWVGWLIQWIYIDVTINKKRFIWWWNL